MHQCTLRPMKRPHLTPTHTHTHGSYYQSKLNPELHQKKVETHGGAMFSRCRHRIQMHSFLNTNTVLMWVIKYLAVAGIVFQCIVFTTSPVLFSLRCIIFPPHFSAQRIQWFISLVPFAFLPPIIPTIKKKFKRTFFPIFCAFLAIFSILYIFLPFSEQRTERFISLVPSMFLSLEDKTFCKTLKHERGKMAKINNRFATIYL